MTSQNISLPNRNSLNNWILAGAGSALCGVGIIQLFFGGDLIAIVPILAGGFVASSQFLCAMGMRS